MTRRVLVTGASGFVGAQTLAPLAAAGFEVHTFGRTAPGEGRHHAGDLFDRDRVRQVLGDVAPSHVLHCAWYVTHGAFWRAPENLDWVAATLLLARAAAAAGVKRFIGVGTCAEYDWSDGGVRARREDDPVAPATLYGLAKNATQELLARAFVDSAMRVAWARLFHLYGAGESPQRLMPSLALALIEGRPAACRHGQLERDVLPVEEAGRALAAIVASDACGPINVGSGRGMRLGDLALAIGRCLGREAQVVVEERPAPGEPARMVADIARLAAEAGFAPDPCPERRLAEAVRRIAESAGRPPG